SHEKSTSEPVVRKITYKPQRPQAQEIIKPNLLLLAIGVSQYQDRTFGLDFAHEDAAAVEKAFKNQQGRLFGSIQTKLLTNEQATRSAIIKALDWLSREATQKDVRVLFISGHGGLDRQKNYFFYSHEHHADEDPELYDVKWNTLLDK